MLLPGIAFGLGAAAAQSLSYLLSRHLVSHRGWPLATLLVLAHVWMGAVSLLLLPACWMSDLPPLAGWWLPLAGITVFYLLGQVGLFYALRHTEASRVAPLLGLKIVMLALLAWVVLGKALTAGQWAAVGLSTLAALLLYSSGKPIPWRAAGAILLTCLFYCGSDLCIRLTTNAMGPDQPLRVSLLATCLSHVLGGLLALPLLPWYGERQARRWLAAAPYAGTWLVAMVSMYACIALVNVVLANILQSTRGIISVALGAVLAHTALGHLEGKVSGAVLARRVLAAALMTAAVALYVRGGR